MHELLYGDEAGDLITNLTAISADMRAIIADVRAGRGTIGGLLVDPSIYEDVRRIVGNIERNDILRALVRYSIREDEAAPPAPRPSPEESP
jgi:phospholipid/cholesterol/gamma-HCH transport system substrate-binding protein